MARLPPPLPPRLFSTEQSPNPEPSLRALPNPVARARGRQPFPRLQHRRHQPIPGLRARARHCTRFRPPAPPTGPIRTPANSWLYVPLLLAAAQELHPAAMEQWQAACGSWWDQARRALAAAPPVPPDQLIAALDITPAAGADGLCERLRTASRPLPPQAQVHCSSSATPHAARPSQPAPSRPHSSRRRPPELILSEEKFLANLRQARRGAAAGPSGATAEHLRSLLDSDADARLLFLAAQQLARAQLPDSIQAAVRLGRLVALRKPDGGVRGLVMSDVFRRLVSRTLAQQFTPAFEAACMPHQHALSTKAGAEA